MNDKTFPRSRRIRRTADYQRLWREGKHVHTAHFIVIINPSRDVSRLGITVGRKVGHAVCRNRLKRWIRELFRDYYERFGQTVDLSIIVKRQAGRLSHVQVNRELSTLFARLETETYD
ncbi:MAG: ribonuclease P protein component [Desulfobacterales bacterium]